MIYLAPRQGLFAIIILVSFCLQSLLLVISTDQQLSKSRALKGEQMIAQLLDEARLSLENKDRVSLSVIANRYTSEQDVARLVIRDNNNEILVPVGNAPMQQGNTIEQEATKGDAVIGTVALTLKDISKGEIIAMQWPFIIGSLFLHLLLWIAYGYIARPTKAQINALSREIDDMHREQRKNHKPLTTTEQLVNSVNSENLDDRSLRTDAKNTVVDSKSTGAAVNTSGIHDALNNYLRSQQNDDVLDESIVNNYSQANNVLISEEPHNRDFTAHQTAPSHTHTLSATRSCEIISVQIKFNDEYNMMDLLTPEMRKPYLALCTQLLDQAINELLRLPLLLGVSAINRPHFDENGATAILKANNNHAKVALAGVMLGKLYLMLNKIIHDKHIELSRFALSVKVGVSDSDQSEAMAQILERIGKKEQMLILLPSSGLNQITSQAQVTNIMRPTSVYERECKVFEGGNEAMIQRLADVRNAVLTVENT